MKSFIQSFIVLIFLLTVIITLFLLLGRSVWYPYYEKCFIQKDVEPIECKPKYIQKNLLPIPPVVTMNIVQPKEILSSEQRLKRLLADGNFVFYPKKLTLIGMKNEQLLEVWGELNHQWVLLQTYPFTAFSGKLGPKFKEGDRQIPEGIYKISYLNPNSKYHLSMRVNYPNDFDKKIARKEKRTNLGGDIMIHGKDVTIGCIPIGDNQIEELYSLSEKVGIANIKVILAPVDFRTTQVNIKNDKYPWLAGLYAQIRDEMRVYQ